METNTINEAPPVNQPNLSPKNKQTAKKHTFLRKTLPILITAILLSFAGFIVFLQRHQIEQSSNSSQMKETNEVESLTELPPLFNSESETWHVGSTTSKWQQGKDTINVLKIVEDDLSTRSISLSGQVWYFYQKIESVEETTEKRRQILDYYEKSLTARNWQKEITLDTRKLFNISTHTPDNDFESYIGIKNEEIRIIAIRYSHRFQEISLDVHECPCTATFEVFVSDLFQLNDVLTNQITVINEADNLEVIPPLFPELGWQQNQSDDQQKQALLMHSPPFKEIFISGTEYTAFERIEEGNFRDKGNKMIKYYFENLSKYGWNNYTSIDDVRLSSSGGDGPVGSSMGYIASNDGRIRLLQASYHQEKYDFCPCDVTYEVFVSDIVPIDQLLQKAKEESN